MRRIAFVAALALGLLLAACSTSASPSVSSGGGVRQIQVAMSDQLRFEPADMPVRAGETVDFVVENTGKLRHEFFLGDENAQDHHETEMGQMGGMQQDEANGIFVEAGQVKTLRHTFANAGSVIAGCHEQGHYPAGMKATVTVS